MYLTSFSRVYLEPKSIFLFSILFSLLGYLHTIMANAINSVLTAFTAEQLVHILSGR